MREYLKVKIPMFKTDEEINFYVCLVAKAYAYAAIDFFSICILCII